MAQAARDRAKSTSRHVEYRDHRGQSNGGATDPKVRRRSHEEMGRFRTEQDDTPGMTPGMCVGVDVGDFLNFGKPKAQKKSAKKHSPSAKKQLGACVSTSATGFTEFSMTAAEVYRQECKSDNRGEDAMFFRETKYVEAKGSDNSVLDNSSNSEAERRDARTDRSPAEGRVKNEPSSRNSRFPNAIHVRKESLEDEQLTPPRVGRLDTKNFKPTAHTQGDDSELREARMDLFRGGQVGYSEAEERLNRALQDITIQDLTIDALKRQLRQTQKSLDETVAELKEVQLQSREKQFKATEIRARAVQERKRLEDMYEKQLDQNKSLQDSVSKLQKEVSTLKVSLRNSRSQSRGHILGSSTQRNGNDEGAKSSQVIALKAEVVDLRSKLAEAHAATIDDSSTLHSNAELDDLRQALRTTKAALENEKSLREILEQVQSTSEEAKAKLEDQLKAKTNSEKKARDELVKATATLHRLERERSRKRLHSAADVERLNRQLNKTKEEAAEMKMKLADLEKTSMLEKDTLKKELDELRFKLKKSSSSSTPKNAGVEKENRKLEADVAERSEQIEELKQELRRRDEFAESQTRKVAELETKLKDASAHQNVEVNSKARQAQSQKINELQDQIRLYKAKESSMLAELQMKDALLSDARSCANLQTLSETNIGHVQRQLEKCATGPSQQDVEKMQKEIDNLRQQLAAAEAKARQNEKAEVVQAKEQSFKNEISMMRAKLNEFEAKCKEEKFRADEERRLSHERDGQRLKEIKNLRREKDEAYEAQARLQDELLDVRREIAYSSASAQGQATPKRAKTKGDEQIPSNVKRLRNELALARARLAAARDHSRALDSKELALADTMEDSTVAGSSWVPIEPTPSWVPTESMLESSWVPVGLKKAETEQKADEAELRKAEPEKKADENTAPPSMVSTLKHRYDSLSKATSPASTPRRKFSSAPQEEKKDSPEDLSRQLQASRMRLQQATSVLDSLQNTQDNNNKTVEVILASDEETDSGSGSIEVQRRLYADV